MKTIEIELLNAKKSICMMRGYISERDVFILHRNGKCENKGILCNIY